MKHPFVKFGFIILLIVSLKAVYSICSLASLHYFMLPMIPFIELFTGIPFEWIPEIGYRAPAQIIIEKSCAGGNFFIICYAFLSFKLWKYISFLQFTTRMLFLGMCSYLIMIFANTARIISAIKLTQWHFTETFIDGETAHLALGCILYVMTLFSMNHFITQSHAKTQIS